MPNKGEVERALFSGTSGTGLNSNVRDFYTENSFGRLTLNNAGILPADQRSYYEPPSGKSGKHYWDDSKHSPCSNDGWLSGHDERVADAIRAAAVDFDFKKYDTNNDNVLTPEELAIIVVAPGKGGAWGDVRPAFGGYTSTGVCTAVSRTLTVDGVTISNQYGAGPPGMVFAIAFRRRTPTGAAGSRARALPHRHSRSLLRGQGDVVAVRCDAVFENERGLQRL
jgi:M6 family metalloprotease-like protein